MTDSEADPVHFCVMCDFETTDGAEAYEHDCMKP